MSTPNMLLPVPTVGVTDGPTYANNINSCLTLIDQHDHTTGSGVAITPAAININTSLSMANNLLTNIMALTMYPQSVAPGINSIYESGVDLYFKDGNGNAIRITQSGSVAGSAGTITGLPSGTASAVFAASVFTFQAATLTPANIDGGSFVFRNNTASSKGLTLSPPSAMSTDYALYLPSLPLATKIMTLDTAGNMSAPYTVDSSTIEISSNVIQVKDLGVTTAKLAALSVTTAKIDNLAVTTAKIDNLAVTTGKIAAGGVQTANIADGNVTAAKIIADVDLAGTRVTTSTFPLVVSNGAVATHLMVIRGTIAANGTILLGSGYSVSAAGSGQYTITFSHAAVDAWNTVVSPYGAVSPLPYVLSVNTTQALIRTGSSADTSFSFIAVGQLA